MSRSRRAHRWQPVLTGRLRDEALAAVVAIAGALSDPAALPGREGPAGVQPPDAGLLSGRAGLALFFAYLSETALYPRAEALAWRYLEEAEAALEREAIGVSLCSGFPGIAWAHDHIHRHLCGERDGSSLAGVDEVLIEALEQTRWQVPFELLYGLAGIGVYGLERLPRRSARTLVRLVVERLEHGAEQMEGGLAWFCPPGLLQDAPDGEFNLGVAHGNPGVVGFLARAVSAGVAASRSRRLLQAVTSWVRRQQLGPRATSVYPRSVARNGSLGSPVRAAWCYGDPGVGSVLLAAGVALGDPAVRTEAIRVLRHAAATPEAATGVADAGLCHGAAGLGQVFNRAYQATGDAQLGRAARRWIRRTLGYRREGVGVGGFTARAWLPPGRYVETTDPSLLCGSAGIGLALLAAATPVAPEWDRVLLLAPVAPPARRRV